MMHITEEMLVAYADGELKQSDRKAVEEGLAADPQLCARFEQHKSLRSTLSRFYEPVLQEEVPEKLARLLHAPLDNNVVQLSEARAHRARPFWQNFTAIAATLVGGILIGQLSPFRVEGPAGVGQAEMKVAQGPLAVALETQLASAQPDDAPIQVGVSFLGPEERLCRTFDAPSMVGLACRGDSMWELMLLAPRARGTSSEYRQANSGNAVIMAAAQNLMAGEPLDAEEERQARDAGWKAQGLK